MRRGAQDGGEVAADAAARPAAEDDDAADAHAREPACPPAGSVAGTLQNTSCAASRRLDQPASSEGADGLGDGGRTG